MSGPRVGLPYSGPMAKHRDRHGRGIRGRVAFPNPWTGTPAPLRSHQTKAEFFTMAVHEALAHVAANCPRALVGVDVGVEDVPTIQPAWAPHRVPLAYAVSGTPDAHAQVVLYRRPLERRAQTRRGLRILVLRTLIEQLGDVTGIPADELDPEQRREDEDWD